MDFDYGKMEDIDGNTYKTIQIGQQVWMAENLKTTTYRDGTPIPYGHLDSGTTEAENEEAGFYFIYPHHKVDGISSESEMISAYGIHYNWHAVVNPGGLCPQGWRVPATHDVEQLLAYVLSKDNEKPGDQLKSCRYVDSPLKGSCATTKHPQFRYNNGFGAPHLMGFLGASNLQRLWGSAPEKISLHCTYIGFGAMFCSSCTIIKLINRRNMYTRRWITWWVIF